MGQQVWHRPGGHKGAREGSYGEGTPDLNPEPAALLCVRDVQSQQLQIRLWQKAYHPAVLEYCCCQYLQILTSLEEVSYLLVALTQTIPHRRKRNPQGCIKR